MKAIGWADRKHGEQMAELVRSWPNERRAAHYREQAGKLRDMAEAEPRGELRDQLLVLAAQYDDLAANLAKQ
jgi:hypothetical protein